MPVTLDLSKEVKLDLTKGTTLDLSKGSFINLSKNNLDGVKLRAGAGWNTKLVKSGFFGVGTRELNVDLDLCAICYDKYGNLVTSVYFGHKNAEGIQLDTDDLTGSSGRIDINRMCNSTAKDNENMTINLSKVSSKIEQIDIQVCIYNDYTYEDIDNAYCKLVDTTNNKVLCSVKLQNTGGRNRTVKMASLKKTAEGWVFESLKEFEPYKIGHYVNQ